MHVRNKVEIAALQPQKFMESPNMLAYAYAGVSASSRGDEYLADD